MKTMTELHKNGHLGITSHRKKDYLKTAGQTSDATKEAKSSVKKTMKDIQEYCQKNPGKAMGIAAAVASVVSVALVKALSEKRSTNEKLFSDLFRKGETVWNFVKDGAKPAFQKIKKSMEAARE